MKLKIIKGKGFEQLSNWEALKELGVLVEHRGYKGQLLEEGVM